MSVEAKQQPARCAAGGLVALGQASGAPNAAAPPPCPTPRGSASLPQTAAVARRMLASSIPGSVTNVMAPWAHSTARRTRRWWGPRSSQPPVQLGRTGGHLGRYPPRPSRSITGGVEEHVAAPRSHRHPGLGGGPHEAEFVVEELDVQRRQPKPPGRWYRHGTTPAPRTVRERPGPIDGAESQRTSPTADGGAGTLEAPRHPPTTRTAAPVSRCRSPTNRTDVPSTSVGSTIQRPNPRSPCRPRRGPELPRMPSW